MHKLENRWKTKIIEIAIERPVREITGLEGYTDAMLVFRYKGAVVGTARVHVIAGRIPSAAIRTEQAKTAWPVWKRLVAEKSRTRTVLPSATVVVCTRDRPDDLARCLPHLARMAKNGTQVLIVDNCPSDGRTRQLVVEYSGICYIHEPRPGLNVARNRGLRAAQGEVVAFLDDDAIPDAGWLDSLLANFADPMVAVVTGITLPLELETPAQQWFEKTNSFGRGYVRRVFETGTTSVLGSGQTGAGVNMAIRREAVSEIGFFDEALDGGTPTMSGGDQEFFSRALARGFRIVYEPAALVWHRHRRDWTELRHTLFGYGVGLFAWWTRALIIEKEITVLYWGSRWFISHILGELIRSVLKRPGYRPFDLAMAEFNGAIRGPWRYFRSRKLLVRASRKEDQPIDESSQTDHHEFEAKAERVPFTFPAPLRSSGTERMASDDPSGDPLT